MRLGTYAPLRADTAYGGEAARSDHESSMRPKSLSMRRPRPETFFCPVIVNGTGTVVRVDVSGRTMRAPGARSARWGARRVRAAGITPSGTCASRNARDGSSGVCIPFDMPSYWQFAGSLPVRQRGCRICLRLGGATVPESAARYKYDCFWGTRISKGNIFSADGRIIWRRSAGMITFAVGIAGRLYRFRSRKAEFRPIREREGEESPANAQSAALPNGKILARG